MTWLLGEQLQYSSTYLYDFSEDFFSFHGS